MRSDRKLLPSVVHYGEDGSITVGESAKEFARTDPGEHDRERKALNGPRLGRA